MKTMNKRLVNSYKWYRQTLLLRDSFPLFQQIAFICSSLPNHNGHQWFLSPFAPKPTSEPIPVESHKPTFILLPRGVCTEFMPGGFTLRFYIQPDFVGVTRYNNSFIFIICPSLFASFTIDFNWFELAIRRHPPSRFHNCRRDGSSIICA